MSGNLAPFPAGFSTTSFERVSLEDDLLSFSCFLKAAGDCDLGVRKKILKNNEKTADNHKVNGEDSDSLTVAHRTSH